MLIALSACLYIDDDFHAARVAEVRGPHVPTTDTATPTPTPTPTSTTPGEPPAIAAVEPPFGTDAGGSVVTVRGGPFDPEDAQLEVQFGGIEAVVLDVGADEVQVEAPPSPVTGPVDVTVVTADGSDTARGAFTYWADAAGLAGATGELVWFERVGSSWDADDEPYGRATVRFTEPFDYQFYRFWAPAFDTCTRITDGVPEYAYEPVHTSIDALGGTARMTSPSAGITLDWNAADVRFNDYDLLPNQIAPGEAYDLRLEDTLALPEIELSGVLPMPQPFVVTSPAIAGPTVPEVDAGHWFQWSAPNEADAFLLQIGMSNADGTAFEQELFCVSRDVGSFTVPASLWTRWVPDRQVHVLAGRYNTGDGLLPWNRGRIEVAVQLWQYGIGRSR